MKDYVVYILLSIIYLAFKSTLLPSVATPEITLIMVFYLAFKRPSLEGVFLVFVIGYLEDVVSGNLIGASSFALVFVYAVVFVASQKVHLSSFLGFVIAGALAALVKGTLTYFIWTAVNPDIGYLGHIIAPVILTAIFTAPVMRLLDKLSLYAGMDRSSGGIT